MRGGGGGGGGGRGEGGGGKGEGGMIGGRGEGGRGMGDGGAMFIVASGKLTELQDSTESLILRRRRTSALSKPGKFCH